MIYFIQDYGNYRIKIGHSSDVVARYAALQTACSSLLQLLLVLEGDLSDEASLHARFGTHRSHGEWFHPAPEILAYMLLHASNSLTSQLGLFGEGKPSRLRHPARLAILQLVQNDSGYCSHRKAQAACGLSFEATRKTLARMVRDGQLLRVRPGLFAIPADEPQE